MQAVYNDCNFQSLTQRSKNLESFKRRCKFESAQKVFHYCTQKFISIMDGPVKSTKMKNARKKTTVDLLHITGGVDLTWYTLFAHVVIIIRSEFLRWGRNYHGVWLAC